MDPREPLLCCDRWPKCSGSGVVVRCPFCPAAYARCDEHGGEAGSRRSLRSHKGLYHPGKKEAS